MAKELECEFKTMLTNAEHKHVMDHFEVHRGNRQINYYFDTTRFTLKASEIGLRVRKRENVDYEITCKRKKGYVAHVLNEFITKEQFEEFLETGIIPSEAIRKDLEDIIKGQTVVNYMTLETFRISFPYKSGRLCVDKCKYVDTIDHELIYECNVYEKGKKEFVETVKSLGITYKKADPKMKRAYAALRRKL